eukprot:499584_1
MSSLHDQRQRSLDDERQRSLDDERQSSGKMDMLIAAGVTTAVVGVCVAFPAIPIGVIAVGGVIGSLAQNIGMIPLGIIGVHNYLNYYHEMEKNIGNYKNKKQFKIKKGEHLKQLQKCKQEKKKK